MAFSYPTTQRAPGPTNVYVPSPDATGLLIGFSKDPKKFKLAKYIKYWPVTEPVGLYTRLDPRQSVRVISDASVRWARGAPRPRHENNLTPFDYLEYRSERRDYGFILPEEVNKYSSWKVKATHARMALSQAMTNRTQLINTLVTTTGNWSGNTDTATNINGGAGYWDLASDNPQSPNYLAIKKTFDQVILTIKQLTNSVVGKDDINCVLGPKLAYKLGETDEIRDFLKQSPFAMAQVKGTEPGQNSEYNLPDTLYGINLVVEDSTVDTNNLNSTGDTQSFIWSGGDAVFMSRPDGIDGEEGSPNFSTATLFLLEQLSVETFREARDRREEGHVVDDFVEKLTAPASGYYVSSCLSA